jgi:hypothetical protein
MNQEPLTSDNRNTADAEPFENARAAGFVEGMEPTYALVGTLIVHTDDDGVETYYLTAKGTRAHQMTDLVMPLFRWFSTPRSASQVAEWMAWADAPSDTVKAMIKRGVLVRVDTSAAWNAAKSLRGLRLLPLSLPDLDTPVLDGLMAVKYTPESRIDTVVSVQLATVLWGDMAPSDIPSTVKALARRTGVSNEVAARFILSDVPMLLEYEFVRLERSNMLAEVSKRASAAFARVPRMRHV